MIGKRILVPALAVLAAGLLSGRPAQQAQQEGPEEPGVQKPAARSTVVGPEDTVTIFVQEAAEVSKDWRINPSGELNLPLVGKIQAAGMTVERFEQELVARLKHFFHDPQVYVSVTEQRSQPVTMMGAVATPGIIQLQGRKTLLDLLMAVGGPKDPGPTVTVTRRKEFGSIPLLRARDDGEGKYSTVNLDLKEVQDPRSEEANLVIQPYDVISVSVQPKYQKLVHIMGEVNKPGAIELVQQETVSVVQALAAAGGMTRTAAPGRAMIMHVNPDGVRTEIASVDLKKIIEGKVKDLELIAGDIVVVPSSQWKTYWELTSRSAVTHTAYILARF